MSDNEQTPRGTLIVIEGGDACGKRTQTEALRQRLATLETRVPPMLLSFPRYNTPLGEAIIRHLKGKIIVGDITGQVGDGVEYLAVRAREDPLVFQCMMVADKYHAAAEAEAHLRRGGHVICDRWWQSAFVYGSSDGLDPVWLRDVHRLMPVADISILIDVPAHEASGRRPVARDRYEESMAKRADVRRLYLETWDAHRKDAQGEWDVVDGRGIVDEVHEQIWKLVWPFVSEYGA